MRPRRFRRDTSSKGASTLARVLAAIPVVGTPTSFAFDAPTGVFHVRLHAWTASGRSPASNKMPIFVNVPQPPSAPTGLLGLADAANLVLSWQNGTIGGAPTSIILVSHRCGDAVDAAVTE